MKAQSDSNSSSSAVSSPAPHGDLAAHPAVTCLLITVIFYAVFYAILHPGYAILDDVKMISILVGYPGVQPAPFLIFSNVLLGLLLLPLYGLGTGVNWEIVLFSVLNFLSVWAALYIVLSCSARRAEKVLAGALVLASSTYYALNITFSGTAALACFAGLGAIATACLSGRKRQDSLAALGVGLVFAGSLVRIQMLYLMLPLVTAALLWLYRRIDLRRLGVLAGVAVLLVVGGIGFDRLYVRAHPNWNAYYFYNFTAQAVQDSHRLENMHLEIRRIGWSANDQELFARSFFPDAGTYSADHLQYLVSRVSGIGQNPIYSATSFLERLTALETLLFLFACLAACLWIMAYRSALWTKLGIPMIVALSVAEGIGLTWIYKDPPWVLLASLANTAILCALFMAWSIDPASAPTSGPSRGAGRVLATASIIVAVGSVALAGRQAILTSNDNSQRENAYARILADLGQLQTGHKLPMDAVIISPAYGIPVDWANPFRVDLPKIPYLDTGWSTFSPPYEQALAEFGIQSVPQALYEKSNVYVMSETVFKAFLAKYYQEHGGITVSFETVYTLGYPDRYAGYHDVELYKVVKAP